MFADFLIVVVFFSLIGVGIYFVSRWIGEMFEARKAAGLRCACHRHRLHSETDYTDDGFGRHAEWACQPWREVIRR